MTEWGDWSSWAQAIFALIAILLTPSIINGWESIRSRLSASCYALVEQGEEDSRAWIVQIRLDSGYISERILLCFPNKAGNRVADFAPVSQDDGGLHFSWSLLSHGAISIIIHRMAGPRNIDFRIGFNSPDAPRFYGENIKISSSNRLVIALDPTKISKPLRTNQMRLNVMLAQFCVGYGIVCLKLIIMCISSIYKWQ